ncbi:hypothetical protein V5N11_003721 [Cardamine amara subsp. amara]|uniref:Retrotransposon Copia-like N-terminal domain-containing protein n=1 Tax=Cardamine amara subsp. amara TaxID=228776 RepID=A0ABD1AN23_CARAN
MVAPSYQLAANENPGGVIAHVQFTGENFDEWAQAMRTALRVKKKFGFINGSIVKPKEDDPDYEDIFFSSCAPMLQLHFPHLHVGD